MDDEQFVLPGSTGYMIRMQRVMNGDYMEAVQVRQRCQDAVLYDPILLSVDGKVLNISDCAMDTIDRLNYHRRRTIVPDLHKNLAVVGSIFAVVLTLATSFYNSL